MKKTISVLMCKRLDYSRQVLEHLSKAEGLEDWEVYVYCDLPGNKLTFEKNATRNKGATQAEMKEMISKFAFVKDVKASAFSKGLREATRWALNDVFTNKKSDINLHLEDDILISPCSLKFVEACYPYLVGDVGSVTLVGDINAEPRKENRTNVHKAQWFNCGWGWAIRKEFYFDKFVNAPFNGDPTSWAKDIDLLYKRDKINELRTFARRARNIGINFSTHPSMKNGQDVLNCFDVGEDWCGSKDGPVFEFDFTELK